MKNIKRKLYIIPGHGDKIINRNYRNLIRSVGGGFAVVPIKYTFSKQHSFSKVVERVKKQIPEDCSQDIIFGFSTGALIAYQLSSQIKFHLVLVCSISSILNKDLLLYPKKEVEKIFSDAQIKELSGMKYARPISPFVLFYGTSETSEVIKRTKKLHTDFGGDLIPVVKAEHKLSENYVNTIGKYIVSKKL